MTTVSAEKSSSPWGVRFYFEDGQREGRRGEQTRDDKVGSIVRLFSYQPLIDFSCLVNPTTNKPAVHQLPLALEKRETRGRGGGGGGKPSHRRSRWGIRSGRGRRTRGGGLQQTKTGRFRARDPVPSELDFVLVLKVR